MYREIVFRLTAENHPDLNAKLAGFASSVRKTYDELSKNSASLNAGSMGSKSGTTGSMDNYVSGLLKAAKERISIEKTTNASIQKEHATAAELQAEYDAVRADQELNRLRTLAGEKEKLERELQAKIEAIRKEHSGPVGAQVADFKIQYEREQMADKFVAIDERMESERTRIATKGLAERVRVQRAAEREADQSAAKQKAEIDKTSSNLEAAEGKYRTLQEQIRGANRETVSNLAELGSSLMQAARGFTVLGLAGEEDTEKIVRGLLKIQGAFDIVSGGIQIWVKMQNIIEGTRKAVLATAAAETALAEATQLRVAAQSLGIAVGGGGVASGAAGAAAGGVLRGVGAGAAGAGAFHMLGRFARSAIPRAGAIGGGIATAGGSLLGGAMVGELGYNALTGGGYGFRQGGFNQRLFSMGSSTTGAIDLMMGNTGSANAGMVSSQRRLASQQSQSDQLRSLYASQQAAVSAAIPALRQGYAEDRSGSKTQLSSDMTAIQGKSGQFGRFNAEQQRKRLAEEILAIEGKIAARKEQASQTQGRFEDLITTYNEEQKQLEKDKLDLVVQRAEISRNAAEAELLASERALKNIEDLIENQTRQLMSKEEQKRRAEERFGLLDSGQQSSLLDIFKRGKAGFDLAPEELRQLQQLGSEAADAIVSGQAQARAKAAGVSELFVKEQQTINKLIADIERNNTIHADMAIEVMLDKKVFDDQAVKLAQAIKDSVQEQSGELVKIVLDSTKGIVGGVQTQMNTRIDQLEQQIKDGAGARN